MFNQMKRTLQIRVQYRVKIRFFHGINQSIPGNPGVVDQDIHTAQIFLDVLNSFFHPIKICHVTLICPGLHAICCRLLTDFFRSLLASRINDRHVGAFPSKSQRDRPANPTAGASDQGIVFPCASLFQHRHFAVVFNVSASST